MQMKAARQTRMVSRTVCNKLDCLGDFLSGYVKNIRNRECCYLEFFAGPTEVICRQTGVSVPGLSRRAIGVQPSFDHYVLVEQPGGGEQKSLPASRDLSIVRGNIILNQTLHQVFDIIPRSNSILAIIDPPGYRPLRWSTMKKLIGYGTDWQGYRMDLLLLLPVETALLNNLRRPECRPSITRFFGSSAWLAVYEGLENGRLDAGPAREMLVKIYCDNFKQTGYRYVESHNPFAAGHRSAYYIIWASDRESRLKNIRKIWASPRFLPGELFRQP